MALKWGDDYLKRNDTGALTPAHRPVGARALNLPWNQVIRGANVTLYNQTGVESWANWDWDFWKSQIDNAALIGANCIRAIGSVRAIVDGALDLSTYLNQWRQFQDYVDAKGMRSYPCGAGLVASWATDASLKGLITDTYAAWGVVMEDYADLNIGIDGVNEAFDVFPVNYPPYLILDLLRDIGIALRETTSQAITFDRTAHSAPRWGNDQAFLLDPLVDFHDVHSYYAIGPTDPRPLFEASWWRGKPVILGEFGATTNLDPASRVARYTTAADTFRNWPGFVGGLAWAMHDVTDDPANQWGLFTPSGDPRLDIVDAFGTLPVIRGV